MKLSLFTGTLFALTLCATAHAQLHGGATHVDSDGQLAGGGGCEVLS